jgi:ABC-type glycerol-3-phosphate transport system permease component
MSARDVVMDRAGARHRDRGGKAIDGAAGSRLGRGVASAVLTALACTTIYPIVFVVFTALKTDQDYASNAAGPPRHLTFDNLQAAWEQAHIGSFALHSAIVVTIAVALIAVLASLAGFALVHMEFPLRRTTLVGIVAMMMLPPSVLMVPLFRTVQELGLLNDYAGLILVYASLNLPFSIYLMSSYFRKLPRELLEAAEVDGASTLRTFASIAMPLARPGVLTLVTLNFLWLWNELLFALLLLQDPGKRTLMVGLASLSGEHTSSIPLISAGLFLSLVPPLVVYALFQRNLAEGLTAGAVK